MTSIIWFSIVALTRSYGGIFKKAKKNLPRGLDFISAFSGHFWGHANQARNGVKTTMPLLVEVLRALASGRADDKTCGISAHETEVWGNSAMGWTSLSRIQPKKLVDIGVGAGVTDATCWLVLLVEIWVLLLCAFSSMTEQRASGHKHKGIVFITTHSKITHPFNLLACTDFDLSGSLTKTLLGRNKQFKPGIIIRLCSGKHHIN